MKKNYIENCIFALGESKMLILKNINLINFKIIYDFKKRNGLQ